MRSFGFTLIELLPALSIVSLLLGIGLPNFNTSHPTITCKSRNTRSDRITGAYSLQSGIFQSTGDSSQPSKLGERLGGIPRQK